MKLRKVTLRGFKGLEREYEIGEATLLAGPNGAGKSACLEAVRYALSGVVPAGKSLDRVAAYFPPRGGTVTLEDAEGNWIKRGITRDLEKAKVSETFETSEEVLGGRWRAEAQVLDFREFTALSAERRREYILRLCGGGSVAAPKEIMDTLAREYAKEIGGPGAKPDILGPAIEDLPEELRPLARAWIDEIAGLVGGYLVEPGKTTSETMLKLLEGARAQRLASGRGARDARSALRELEAQAQGARAAASEIQTAKALVEDLTKRREAARVEAARWDEARRRVDAARENTRQAEIAQAKVLELLQATPAPGPMPVSPGGSHEREEILIGLSEANQALSAAKGREATLNSDAGHHDRCCEEVETRKKRIAARRGSSIGRVVGLVEKIPDTADPSMPALRAAVEEIAKEWREDLAGLEEELREWAAKAEETAGAPKALAAAAKEVLAAMKRRDKLRAALEALDKEADLDGYAARDAAWRKADKAFREAQERAEKARARYREAALAEGKADDRLAELPEPAESPEAIDAELTKAREALVRADEAAGAVRAYEDAIKLAESCEVAEEAWKRAEKALKRVQEALVGEATAPLVADANKVLERAGRPERIYLELENDRGRPIFELGWIAAGVRVPLDALSSGQAVLVSAALSIAITLRSKGLRVLLIEADPLDEENLRGLFPSLRPWAEKLDALIVATASPVEDPAGWKVMRLEQAEGLHDWTPGHGWVDRSRDPVANGDRGEEPVEFTETPRGRKARESWARAYHERDGAPEGEADR